MTDLFLMGSFILCIVIGYLVVKKSGGMLEQMLFHNPKVWYDSADAAPEPDRTWRTRLKQLAAGRRNAVETPGERAALPGKQRLPGRRKAAETPGEGGSALAKSRGASGFCSAQRKHRAGNSGLKAGIKHEWKTN